METIVVDNKIYEIKPSTICTNCMFYNNKTGEQTCNDKQAEECFISDFIFIREINSLKN